MNARRNPAEPQAMDAANAALCDTVSAVALAHLSNSPDFDTGRISENTRLRAAYLQAAATIHSVGLQAIARVEAAQILAAAMDRRTAAIQRRNCTRSEQL